MRYAASLFAATALLACSYPSASERRYHSAGATSAVQPSELSPEQIRMVQRALTGRGFATNISGDFDAQTTTALADFQRSRDLPANGMLTPETTTALGLDPREVMPVRGATASSNIDETRQLLPEYHSGP